MPDGEDRRRFGRINLENPLTGFIDETPVEIMDMSVVGFRVAHETRFQPGHKGRIRVSAQDGRTIEFTCTVIRSTLYRLGKTAAEKTIYTSGVEIHEPTGDSEKVLRDLIAERVIRALQEQKENARGVPPIGDYTFQVGKGDRYRRCEFDGKTWRRFETTQANQPANGFTVSAEIEPRQIELLCQTYEQTSPEGQRLTQILAQLSISKKEGGPTRRYVP
jgi:hypothetical protein